MRERKKIIRSVFLCAFVSAFVACSNKADYKDSSLPVETRVQDLLGRMTVEEKAAQLDMLSAKEIVIDENTLSDEQLKHFVDSMCIGAVHDLYPRAFYAAYNESPEIMRLAMGLGWTRNVAILEGCGSSEERAWYIRAALRLGWKKAKLLESIKTQAWRNSSLDAQAVSCYTEEKEISQESECDDENSLCVLGQYLPQPDGGVRDEGLGEESGAGVTISYRIGGHQPGGDWQSGLSPGAAQAIRARNRLRRSRGAAAYEAGLRRIRSADRHGQRESAEYAPHLR